MAECHQYDLVCARIGINKSVSARKSVFIIPILRSYQPMASGIVQIVD